MALEDSKVVFLLKPDAEVGFYNNLLHWSALMQGAMEDANHPYHPKYVVNESKLQSRLGAIAGLVCLP